MKTNNKLVYNKFYSNYLTIISKTCGNEITNLSCHLYYPIKSTLYYHISPCIKLICAEMREIYE